MITKKDLLRAIAELEHDQFNIAVRLRELEKMQAGKAKKATPSAKKKRSVAKTEKKKPGRPRKNAA